MERTTSNSFCVPEFQSRRILFSDSLFVVKTTCSATKKQKSARERRRKSRDSSHSEGPRDPSIRLTGPAHNSLLSNRGDQLTPPRIEHGERETGRVKRWTERAHFPVFSPKEGEQEEEEKRARAWIEMDGRNSQLNKEKKKAFQ